MLCDVSAALRRDIDEGYLARDEEDEEHSGNEQHECEGGGAPRPLASASRQECMIKAKKRKDRGERICGCRVPMGKTLFKAREVAWVTMPGMAMEERERSRMMMKKEEYVSRGEWMDVGGRPLCVCRFEICLLLLSLLFRLDPRREATLTSLVLRCEG